MEKGSVFFFLPLSPQWLPAKRTVGDKSVKQTSSVCKVPQDNPHAVYKDSEDSRKYTTRLQKVAQQEAGQSVLSAALPLRLYFDRSATFFSTYGITIDCFFH